MTLARDKTDKLNNTCVTDCVAKILDAFTIAIS